MLIEFAKRKKIFYSSKSDIIYSRSLKRKTQYGFCNLKTWPRYDINNFSHDCAARVRIWATGFDQTFSFSLLDSPERTTRF